MCMNLLNVASSFGGGESCPPVLHPLEKNLTRPLARSSRGVGRGEAGPAVDGGTVVDKRMAEAGFILDPEEERALTYTAPSALGEYPIHGGKKPRHKTRAQKLSKALV